MPLTIQGEYGFYDQGVCAFILFYSLDVDIWARKYYKTDILVNFTEPSSDNRLSDKEGIYAHTVKNPRQYPVEYLINVYAEKFERRNWDWNTVRMLSHEYTHVYFYEEASDKAYLFHWLLDYLVEEGYEKYYPMKKLPCNNPQVMVYDIPRLYNIFSKILEECGWKRNEERVKELIVNTVDEQH